MRKRSGKRSWMAGLLCACAPLAHGQQAVAVAATVPRVEVKASPGAYDPRRDDTAAKIVVGSEELARYGDGSVVDALKRVPGVTVTSSGRGSEIRMRGLGAGYTQILVNGEEAPLGFSIDALAPGQVERIEVIRSATAEFSTQSIAGTINVVLKRASRKAERQLQLGYGGDTSERTPRVTLLLSDRSGRMSYSVSAYARASWLDRGTLILDSERDGAGRPALSERTDSDEEGLFRIASIVPRATWTLASGDTLSLEGLLSEDRYRFDGQQAAASLIGGLARFPELRRDGANRNGAMQADLVWNTRLASQARLELKAGIEAGRADRDWRYRQVEAQGLAHDSRTVLDASQRGVRTSARYTRRLGEDHQLSAGWEGSRLVRDERNREFGTASAGAYRIDATTVRAAAYVQDEWTVLPHWSLYLGVRAERIDIRIDAAVPARTTATVWSPIVQTLYKFPASSGDQLRLALTRTFKAPELASLLPRRQIYELNAATNPDVVGNPALRPELARGIDLTYEHYFAKNALVSVGVSRREIDDHILSVVTREPEGRWVARPSNAGRARLRGLELEAKLPLSLFGADLPSVEMRASLSRNWSEVDQVPGPGNRVGQQVPLSAILAADYARGVWTFGGSAGYRRGAWTRVTGAQSVRSWSRRDVDLYALWKMDGQRQWRVTVGNVLGEDNQTASGYASADRLVERASLTPGHVSVRALFELKF